MKRAAFVVLCFVAVLIRVYQPSTLAQAPAQVFYKYEIIARSGVAGLTGFGDNPSINDAGSVAFVGVIAGGEGVFVGDATAAARNITPTFLRTFGRAVQINNADRVAARDRIGGAPPPTLIRLWNATSTDSFTTIARGGGSIFDHYDAVFSHPSTNNLGNVVFSALDGSLTKLATPALIGFNERVIQGAPRPMIADDSSIVVRDGGDVLPAAFTIHQFNNQLTNSIQIAATGGSFGVLGQSPGLSDDGRIVAFFGDRTAVTPTAPSTGPGVFASVCQVASCLAGGARYLQQIASTQGNNNGRLDLPWEIHVDGNGDGVVDPGEDDAQFVEFDADSRVGVNATHTIAPQQRAVSVVYRAKEVRQMKYGLYSSRLNLFGDGVAAFNPQTPGFLTVGRPALIVQEGQTVTDWKTGAQLNGVVQSFAVFDPVNNRDRGDVALWVLMNTGEQAIVRARPQTVLYLEFDPVNNFVEVAQPAAAFLFRALGIPADWSGDMASVLTAAGRGFDAAAIRNNIVDQVQLAFDQLQIGGLGSVNPDVSVKVLGKTTDTSPLDGPVLRIFIGDGPLGAASCNGVLNRGCGLAGISHIDIFNQGLSEFPWDSNGDGVIAPGEFGDYDGDGVQEMREYEKSVLVFVDNIFRVADYGGCPPCVVDGLPDGHFIDPTSPGPHQTRVLLSQSGGPGTISQADVEHAIAGTIAHEVGHALGLRHINNARNDLLMNQNIDPDELRLSPASHANRQVFGNVSEILPEITTVAASENSGARLAFALGSDENTGALTRHPPGPAVIAGHTRIDYRMPALIAPGALTVAQALVGIVPTGSDDSMPEIIPLGGGDLAGLLDIDLPVRPGDKVFVLASTTGTGIDVFTMDPATAPAVGTVTLDNLLTIVADSRLRLTVIDDAGQPLPAPAIDLFQVVGGVPSRIGGTGPPPGNIVGPRVASATPSGTIAGPVDRFTLTFSEAMNPATFTLADVVSLTGPSGAIAATSIVSLSATEFEVRFASQSAGGAYTVVVGPNIEDLAGNLMDQDQDGTKGEVPGDRFTAAVTVNPPDTAGPRVTSAAPTGTVAGPVDRFTLTFNEAINAATFTLADVVSLTGPGGAVAATDIVSLSATQFEVRFASQAAGGTYTLVVGPNIEDAAGNQMDQDQDGIKGEVPGDRFSASVILNPPDTTGPRITAASPSGTVPDPVDRFTLTFNEAINPATFALADVVSLTGPSGAIAATSIVSLSGTQFEVRFASQAAGGTYAVTVGPEIEDVAGNRMDQNQNGIKGEVPGDRFTASVVVNPPDIAGPRVTSATPSGTVPGPVDRFTLTFSEAINGATFTLADVVSLTGPGGAIAATSIVPLSGTQFEVRFASQAAGGAYSLVVGPNIEDIAGNLMDQDQDGIKGEVPGDRFTASVTIEPVDATGPRVTAASPSGTVPGPVDRFTLTFSEAINGATFTLADVVSLTGPSGAIAATSIVSLSGTQFEVRFASQAAGGTYTVVVGPNIEDVAGNLMDQDQDGIKGEVPGDRFSASVIVNPPDITGPRVTSASPTGTVPGPVDRFTLTFNEAIDPASFALADVVSLTGPGGAIAATAIVPLTGTQFEVRFASQAAGGAYTLVVGPNIEDVSGNQMDQDQDGIKGEVPGDRFTASVTIEAASCAVDLTSQVRVARSGFRRNSITGRYVQSVTITNRGAPITGAMALVLDGLPATATLFEPSGVTGCALPAGSPFKTVPVGGDGVLSRRESVTIALEFINPAGQPISYSPRVLSGDPK